MEQRDLESISEIVARYGYVEWTVIGFSTLDYEMFSYFTDPTMVPVFKNVLRNIIWDWDFTDTKGGGLVH